MIRILPLELDRQYFCLYEDTALLAKCEYSDGEGEIYGIEPINEAAARPWYVALLKATMSSMEYAGVKTVRCRDERLFALLKVLRFKPTGDGAMEVSLEGYFDTACEACSHN